MSLEAVIRHVQRERDACALRLSELRQRETEADNELRAAAQQVADAERAFGVRSPQLTTSAHLQQSYTILERRRGIARIAQVRLEDIKSSMEDALTSLLAVRQQLKMYQRVMSRREA